MAVQTYKQKIVAHDIANKSPAAGDDLVDLCVPNPGIVVPFTGTFQSFGNGDFSDATNGIQVNFAGKVKLDASLYLTNTAGARIGTSFNWELATAVGTRSQIYIRNASNHAEDSVYIMAILLCNPGDVFVIRAIQTANAGDTLLSLDSRMYVERYF